MPISLVPGLSTSCHRYGKYISIPFLCLPHPQTMAAQGFFPYIPSIFVLNPVTDLELLMSVLLINVLLEVCFLKVNVFVSRGTYVPTSYEMCS